MFEVGQRIETQPWTDAWMRGERYGVVTIVGRRYIHARMDASRAVRKFLPETLREVR